MEKRTALYNQNMITDRDIIKLKSVFATKEDLGRFATKDDFATKEDFKDLKISVVGVEMRMGKLEHRMDSLEERMGGLDEKMDQVMVTVSGIAGDYSLLVTENAAGAEVLSRHTRQLEAVAEGSGIMLPD